jgi:hypothetical protein
MKISDKLNLPFETSWNEDEFLSVEEVEKCIFSSFAKYILLFTTKTNDEYLLLTEIIPNIIVPEEFRLFHLRFHEFPYVLLSPFNLEIPIILGRNDWLVKCKLKNIDDNGYIDIEDYNLRKF